MMPKRKAAIPDRRLAASLLRAVKKTGMPKTPKKAVKKKAATKKRPIRKSTAIRKRARPKRIHPVLRGPHPMPRSAVDRLGDPPAGEGTLTERVSRSIERELSRIETLVGTLRITPDQRAEAERRARTLATLARTLREVTRLRAEEEKAKKPADDDYVPCDINEFRRDLAAKMAGIIEEAKRVHPDEA